MHNVSIVKCCGYDMDKVRQAVKQSLIHLGGVEKYIKAGDKVLLKPNLLMKKNPDKGVTTHPAVIEAITREIQEAGGIVIIGDSPGGPFNKRFIKSVYKACGMEEVAQDTGAVLNYNMEEVEVDCPEGKVVKKVKIAGMVDKVDVVISAAKLKTHGMMTYTGAVKNMFGIVPGMLKVDYHFRMCKPDDFAQLLVDICANANPGLSFIDAVTAMEGNGPSGGTLRDMGLIMAGDNPFSLDLAAISAIGFSISSVPTVEAAVQRGLCPPHVKELNIFGESLNKLPVRKFKKPEHSSAVNFFDRFLPGFMSRFLTEIVSPYPAFSSEICTACGTCSKHCPPKAINMVNKRPEVDLKACIKCYCCQELCEYNAIRIKRFLNKGLFRNK